jgi:site-specific recombinase XerD
MLVLLLQHHPDGPLSHFGGEPAWSGHDSILSSYGASGKPGALHLRNRAILAIALYGGLRAAEIAGLRLAHFVPDQGLIGFVGKGQRQRSVALPPQALEIVRQYLDLASASNGVTRNGHATQADAPLLRKEDGSGDGLSYLVINRVVTRWTRRHLGVRLTPHKLRHAYGKHCVDRGVDIRIIAEALGHESLESTKIYTQVSFERTRRIAELFALPGS